MFVPEFATAKPSRIALACAIALLCSAASAWAGEDVATTSDPSVPDQKVTRLDRVVARGTASQEQVERTLTPGNVTVLDGDANYRRVVGNMADLLRDVPGVWAQSGSGGDAMFLSIRGSNLDATDYDNNGVKLFQDGLPVTTADGNNHNRFLDPLQARSIVIARGANALTYGASTLGGAIDVMSPTASDGDPGMLFLDADSDGGFGARLRAGGMTGDLDGLLTLEGRHRDGYRAHSRQNRVGLYANAGWKVSEAFDLRLFATRIDNRQQLSGALTRAQFDADPWQANPSAVSGNYQLNVTSTRLAATGDWRIGEGRRLQFGLSWENQSLYHPIVDKVLVDFDGPGPNPPVEVFSLLIDTDQRTVGGMLRYGVIAGNHDLLLGLNLADTRVHGGNYRNDGGRRNGQTDAVDNLSRSVELFAVDRWRFAPGWTLVYGAQGVWTSRDVRILHLADGSLRHPKGDFGAINPRLGLIREIGANGQAYASLSRLFEPPTTFELRDDARGGGAVLDPMRGNVVEVGLRGSTPSDAQATGWRWDLSAYYARIRDEILSIDNPAAPGTSLTVNVPATVHAGIEAQWATSMPLAQGGWRLEPMLGASFNMFRFDADPVYGDNRLPAAPRYVLRGELMLRRDDGLFFGPTFDRVGQRFADFANGYRVGGYTLFGLRFGIARDRWDGYVELRNLFDRDYVGSLGVRNAATAGDAILQPGAPRSVQAGIRIRF